MVWFKKIQEDNTSNYSLLLDEPGLNLHASAQADLLRFLQDLSKDYQILYTTHSPFMIPTGNLDRVRTVLETEKGSVISESIQEKDPNTLFPCRMYTDYTAWIFDDYANSGCVFLFGSKDSTNDAT